MKNRWILFVLLIVGCVFFVGCAEQPGVGFFGGTATPTPTPEPIITKFPIEMGLKKDEISSNFKESDTTMDNTGYTVSFVDKNGYSTVFAYTIKKYSSKGAAEREMNSHHSVVGPLYITEPIEFGDSGIAYLGETTYMIHYTKTNILVELEYDRYSGITADDIKELKTYAGIIESKIGQ